MPHRDSTLTGWLLLSALMAFFAPSGVQAQTWRPVGPKPILNAQAVFDHDQLGPTFDASGRVTAIVVDPTIAGRIFVGTANGGLWVVDNAEGTTPVWNRISDNFLNPTQAIGAIALDTSTSPPNIYVGTGEGNFGNTTYYGRGLFMTADTATATQIPGATWFEPLM